MPIIDATSRTKWDRFVTSHPEANFLQSWDFYDFHQNRGNTVLRRCLVDEKGKILAAYAGVVEAAKRGRHLAIAGGPILDWQNQKILCQVFQDIKEQGQRQACHGGRACGTLEPPHKVAGISPLGHFGGYPHYAARTPEK